LAALEILEPRGGYFLTRHIKVVGLSVAQLNKEHKLPGSFARHLRNRNDVGQLELGTESVVLISCNGLVDVRAQWSEARLRGNHYQVVEQPQMVFNRTTGNLLANAVAPPLKSVIAIGLTTLSVLHILIRNASKLYRIRVRI
jgi:hypothetical protein